MNISTLPPFRNLSYEFFVIQHIITFFGLIIAIMIHIPDTAIFARVYVYLAIGFYLFSRLVQTLIYFYRNVRPGHATLIPSSSDFVQVRVHGSRVKSWTPGSFVLLGIPRFGLFQSHPATIASTPSSANGDLIFILRKHRGFTHTLLQNSHNNVARVALIDGPYGGKQDDLAAYSTAVLIAGSTGISFVLPILADMAERAAKTRLPVHTVHFIWSAKEHAQLTALVPEIQPVLVRLRSHGIDVVTHMHFTGSEANSMTTGIEKAASESSSSSERLSSAEKDTGVSSIARPVGARSGSETSAESSSGPHIQPISGRPDLNSLIVATHKDASTHAELGIAVCGPLSMSRDVRSAVAGMSGVYLHVEGFAW